MFCITPIKSPRIKLNILRAKRKAQGKINELSLKFLVGFHIIGWKIVLEAVNFEDLYLRNGVSGSMFTFELLPTHKNSALGTQQ
jgi:hypothetical protein